MERRQSDDAPRWYEDQRLDLDTVVRAYTAGPALAAGVAATRGTLAPGSDADLVVWQQDRDAPPSGAGFREARVALTVVGGEAVYTSPVTR
jgi:predicted amidohydrolase YtcJ